LKSHPAGTARVESVGEKNGAAATDGNGEQNESPDLCVPERTAVASDMAAMRIEEKEVR